MTKDGKKTGGRVKGTPNKATAEIKAAAQRHGQACIDALVDILKNGESEQARIAAAKELLDRGYGKSQQNIELEAGSVLTEILSEISATADGLPEPVDD